MLGPESHSPNADDLSALYWVMVVLATLLAIGVNVALIALAMRYRAARGREPRRVRSRRPAQFLITGGLTGLAIVLIVLGIVYTDSARTRAMMGDKYQAAIDRGRAAERKWRESGEAETIRAVAPDGGDVAMPLTWMIAEPDWTGSISSAARRPDPDAPD